MRYFLFSSLISVFSFSSVGAQSFVLSFDDAPRGDTYLSGNERTKKLIETLADLDVHEAVIYANTRESKAGDINNRLMSYSKAGHVIANHTATHPDLDQISAAEFIAEIKKADEILRIYPSFRPWFRYPYLREGLDDEAKHLEVKKFLSDSGYRQGYVTVEVYDWHIDRQFQKVVEGYSPEELRRFGDFYVNFLWESLKVYEDLAIKALGYSPAHVILLHENDINALFIADFIKLARAKGFRTIRATEAFNDPLADPEWDNYPYSMRRLRTVAETKGISRREATPKLLETEYIDDILRRAGLIP